MKVTLPLNGEIAGYLRVIAGPEERTPVSVVINEVMTNNETIFADGDGDFPDWIEFYNYGERPADLSGYSLSDKEANLDKWVFPAGTILGPGEYLVVFGSGEIGEEIPAGELHAAFKLSNGSEPVVLSDPDARRVDRLDPGPLPPDTTVGRAHVDLEILYSFGSALASPGEPNHEFGAGAPNPFRQAPMFTNSGSIIGNFPYSSSNGWNRNREVEASFEVYEPGDGEKLRIDLGLKIFGGWGSRGYPQKSMALFARSDYGYGKIRHPFFPNKAVDSFESIVLRNSGNDNQSTWLTYPRPPINEVGTPASHGRYFVNGNFTMFRDAMMQSLVEGTGLDTQGYRPAVLYVTGDSWGIYNIREKLSEHYVETVSLSSCDAARRLRQ